MGMLLDIINNLNLSDLKKYDDKNSLTSVSDNLKQVATNVPTQEEIQKNIQQVAPNPSTQTSSYNGKAYVQGYNGVNQGGYGFFGLLKQLINNAPQLKPHKAKDVLSNEWFNEALANVDARNRLKFNIALGNVVGNLLATQIKTEAEKQIALQKIMAQQFMQEKELKIKEQYNNILDNYYKGLLNYKQAELELKKLGIQNPQDHIKQFEYQQRLKKYPDPQTWWSNISQIYSDMGYDLNVKDINQINQAYEYYLKTGQLPSPKIDKSWFGKDDVIGFDFHQQTQTQQQPAQPVKQQDNSKIVNEIINHFTSNGVNVKSVMYDPEKQKYIVVDENGNAFYVDYQ